jgi:hypothetical protein
MTPGYGADDAQQKIEKGHNWASVVTRQQRILDAEDNDGAWKRKR